MIFYLANFIYSLLPNRGYDIQAWSPGVEIKKWRAFSEPLPVNNETLEKVSPVWSLQRSDDNLLVSRFTLEGKDEAFPVPRIGQFSHHIIIPMQQFISMGISPMSFQEYFLTNPQTIDQIPPIVFDIEKTPKVDTAILSNIKSNTLINLICTLLKQERFTLVCHNSDTSYMLKLVSALFELLPFESRAITFISAPLDRRFKKVGRDKEVMMKIVQNEEDIFIGNEKVIDLELDYPRLPTLSVEACKAEDIVNTWATGR
jgi:hypothetical protein